jgi:hypothetical protein
VLTGLVWVCHTCLYNNTNPVMAKWSESTFTRWIPEGPSCMGAPFHRWQQKAACGSELYACALRSLKCPNRRSRSVGLTTPRTLRSAPSGGDIYRVLHYDIGGSQASSIQGVHRLCHTDRINPVGLGAHPSPYRHGPS